MEIEAWLAVAVVLAVFAVLQLRRDAQTDLLFLAALMVLTLAGVVTPQQALAGFANSAVLTIAGLLVVAAALRYTGVLDLIGRKLLGSARTVDQAMWRLAPTLLAASAFLLNTALVAMVMPVALDWCRRHEISPSKLLLPISYLAILGGVCTLMGTSTTLVANGKLRDEFAVRQQAATAVEDPAQQARSLAFAAQVRPLGLFELGQVGLPCALAGAAYLLLLGRRLMPNRTDMLEQLGEQRREYLVELLVQPNCPLVGKTVEDAGLRHLPGLFLIEIDREGDILTPVTPQDVIHAEDRLIFTGVVSTIVDLEKIPGLVPAEDRTFEFQARGQRHLTEVVLSRTSPLIGATVRDADFRKRYNAAVVAVHRNGVRLTNKIGLIRLEPGDTLLLQTREEFLPTYRNSRDFYLVSGVDDAQPRRHDKLRLAAALAVLLIIWLTLTGWLQGYPLLSGLGSPPIAALAVAVLMMVTRCLPVSEARAAIDLQTLLTIVGALGLGIALTTSGAAGSIAQALVEGVGHHPYVLLIVIYLMTLVFTETITNNAVAAMLLPLAVEVAWQGGYNPRPFVIAITLAASLSFLTPIGYQTNLMVMGPGGYRARDYLKCGMPMAIIVSFVALVLIPLIWPF